MDETQALLEEMAWCETFSTMKSLLVMLPGGSTEALEQGLLWVWQE